MIRFKEILLLIVYVAISLMGMTFIKMGVLDKENVLIKVLGIAITPKLFIGIMMYGISFVLYIAVISKMQISLALPLAATMNSIGIVLTGVLVFNEALSMGQIVGIGVCIVGGLLIGIFS